MKRLFLFFVLLTILGSVNTAISQTYKIKVKIRGLSEKDTLLLGHRFADKVYADDTLMLDKNSTGIFQGDSLLDGGIYVIIIPSRKSHFFEFLIEDKSQVITMETDTTDFIGHMKVTGSDVNKRFFEWQVSMNSLQKRMTIAQEQIKKYSNTAPDSMKYWMDIARKIDSERKEYWNKLVTDNPGSLLSKLILAMTPIEIPESGLPDNTPARDSLDRLFKYLYNKDHFFDNIDFSDQRLLRTPLVEAKMKEFFTKIVVMHPDSLTKEATKVCEMARKNKEVFRYVVIYTTNYFETSQYMGMDRIFVNLAEKYYLGGEAWWADSALLAKIRERVLKLKPNLVGEIAADLKMETNNGTWERLHQIKAEYTILIFWEPGCGHCKKEIPELHTLYLKYKDKGLQVFAVFTQHEDDEWRKFIEEHHLEWINVWDKYNFSNFRNLYDIYSTPVIYLLDKDKKIIAKRISIENIEKLLEYQLNSEK